MRLFFLIVTFWSSVALGGTTVTKTFDSINATGGSSLAVPSTGTTLDTDTNALTLQNKFISGAQNTLTNISLTTAVTGTLPVGNGGLGVANPTSGSVLVGNGSSAVSLVAAGTSGNILTSNGTTWVSSANTATPILIVTQWVENGSSAAPVNENNLQVYSWTSALAQTLYTNITIPSTYASGVQITLRVKFYSPTYASGNDLMQTVSTLIRTGTDAITSTTNQRTSTNAAATPAGANIPYLVSFDLTDSTGKINGVSVSAGDTIIVQLARGTDTDVGEIHGLVWGADILY